VSNRNRDAYRRIHAPVLCRPAGLRLFAPLRDPLGDGVARDVATARIYSDDPFDLGDRLNLEILARAALPEESRKFVAEVVWLEAQPAPAIARYDVGLRIERIDPEAADLLRSVLDDSVLDD